MSLLSTYERRHASESFLVAGIPGVLKGPHHVKVLFIYTDTVDSSSTPACRQISWPIAVSLLGAYRKTARVGRGHVGGALARICNPSIAAFTITQLLLAISGQHNVHVDPCGWSYCRASCIDGWHKDADKRANRRGGQARTGCLKLHGAVRQATGCRVAHGW